MAHEHAYSGSALSPEFGLVFSGHNDRLPYFEVESTKDGVTIDWGAVPDLPEESKDLIM